MTLRKPHNLCKEKSIYEVREHPYTTSGKPRVGVRKKKTLYEDVEKPHKMYENPIHDIRKKLPTSRCLLFVRSKFRRNLSDLIHCIVAHQ